MRMILPMHQVGQTFLSDQTITTLFTGGFKLETEAKLAIQLE